MLIVDDVPLNLAVLKALLTRIGLRDVATAVDGEDAWEKIRASEKPFDLVLTDMWMPNLDGSGLLQAIRANPALEGLRVAIVTADVEMQSKAAEMGFDGILFKPVTSANLSKLLAGE
jgi:CheY-like chemotaxis protein